MHMHRQTRTLSPAFQLLFWINAITAVKWNHPSHTPPTKPQEKTSMCQGVESVRRRWVALVADSRRFPEEARAVLMHSYFFHVRRISSLYLHFAFFGASEWNWDNGPLTAQSSLLLCANIKCVLKSACWPHASPLNAFKSIKKKVTWFKHAHIKG